MPDSPTGKFFVPWQFKRLGRTQPPQFDMPRFGWVSIYLTRRPPAGRRRTMWLFGLPPMVAIPTLPTPIQVHLQAVNRSSVY